MAIAVEHYPNKYLDLLQGSVPDYTAPQPSRGYSGSFPAPIGSGRPVSTGQSSRVKTQRKCPYMLVEERDMQQNKAPVRKQPQPDTTEPTLRETETIGHVLLGQFKEVVDSILDLLPTEEQLDARSPEEELGISKNKPCSAPDVAASATTTPLDSAGSVAVLVDEFTELINSILDLLPQDEVLDDEQNGIDINVEEKRKGLDILTFDHDPNKAKSQQNKDPIATSEPFSIPCAAVTAETTRDAETGGADLLNQFMELISSILDLLPEEEEFAVEQNINDVNLQKKRKRLEISAFDHYPRKAKSRQPVFRITKPERYSYPGGITLSEFKDITHHDLGHIGCTEISRSSHPAEADIKSRKVVQRNIGEDWLVRLIKEEHTLGGRENVVQRSSVTC
jgi:hypothetical protein